MAPTLTLTIPFSRRAQAPSPSANFTATAIWIHRIQPTAHDATGLSPLACVSAANSIHLSLQSPHSPARVRSVIQGASKRGDRPNLRAAPSPPPLPTHIYLRPGSESPLRPPSPPRLASNHVQFAAADAAEPELPGADGLPAQHGRVIHAAAGAGIHGMSYQSLQSPRLSEATRVRPSSDEARDVVLRLHALLRLHHTPPRAGVLRLCQALLTGTPDDPGLLWRRCGWEADCANEAARWYRALLPSSRVYCTLSKSRSHLPSM